MYVSNWDNTYNTQRNKASHVRLDTNGTYIKPEESPTYTEADKGLDMYPLRELFISVDLIKEAIGKERTVVDMLKHILDAINKSSMEIFDISLGTSSYPAAEFSFIDKNFLGENNEKSLDSIKRNHIGSYNIHWIIFCLFKLLP